MYNPKTNKTHIFCGMLCLLSIILDQASKLCAINHLDLNAPYSILSFFNFTLTFNRGISFSMLNNYDNSLLIILACICLFLLLWAYKQFNNDIERILLSLIIGGAIGNLIDRFVYGMVVDFIDIYLPSRILYGNIEIHFPIFNMADSFITIGAVGLILYNLFKERK